MESTKKHGDGKQPDGPFFAPLNEAFVAGEEGPRPRRAPRAREIT